MSDEAEFILRLVDQVSGPAGDMGGAMKGLMKQIGATGKSASSGAGVMANAFGHIIADAAELAASKVWALGKAVTGALFGTVDHVQRSAIAFDNLAKHGASGAKIFEHVQDLAISLGLELDSTTKQYQHFLAAQFNPDQADALIKIGADMQSIGASSEEVGTIWTNLSQIMTQGKLNGTDLRQLELAGLSGVLVMEELSRETGISMDQLPKAISAGAIKSGVALNAITNTIMRKTQEGGLGEAGKQMANATLGGLWNQLVGSGKKVGNQFAQVIGPSFVDALGGIKDVLTGVLASDGFKAFMVSVGGVIKDVAAAMKAAAPAIGAFLEGWSAGAAPGIQALGDVLKQVFGLFGDGDGTKGAKEWGHLMGGVMTSAFRLLAAVLPPVVELFKHVAGIMADPQMSNAEKFSAIGHEIMGAISSTIDALKPLVAAALVEVANFAIPKIKEAINFAQLGMEMGQMLIDGLTAGIWKKMMAPIDAIKGVGQAVIGAAKEVFDQHSPSKVFADIGAMNVAGFGKGMAPMNDVIDMSVASVSASSASTAGDLSLGRGGRSISVTVAEGAIQVNGAAQPEATAEAVKRMMVTQLAGAFEDLQLEVA